MAEDYTEKVLDEMNTRRLDLLALIAVREREMREDCCELKDIEVRIAHASLRNRSALPELLIMRQRISTQWLTEHNKPKGWLNPAYNCDICKDTGYIDGKLCACVRNEAARRMFRDAGLTDNSPSFERFDLSMFSETTRTKNGRTLREYMAFLRDLGLSYSDRFPKLQTPNLLLSGPTGCGKTFILDSIAGRVISRGFWVVRTTAFGVNDIMAKALFGRADPDSLFDCDLLALDDLGSEPLLNKVTISSLFSLLNERIAKGKPFIISTNLKPGEILQRYNERIFSRMTDARSTRIIEFEGVDLRRGNQ